MYSRADNCVCVCVYVSVGVVAAVSYPHTSFIFTHSAVSPRTPVCLPDCLSGKRAVSTATRLHDDSHPILIPTSVKSLASIIHPPIPVSSLSSHPIYTPPSPIISLSLSFTPSLYVSLSILKREKVKRIKGDHSRHDPLFLGPLKVIRVAASNQRGQRWIAGWGERLDGWIERWR